jgi:type VI secretion system protein ImpE
MSEADDTAGALFSAGKLDAAIEAANAAVRRAPGELGARILLAELLIFARKLERCDVVLDAAAQADPTAAVVVAEFRQLLRAETARQQLTRDCRMPEFLGEPTPALRASLAGFIALRAGDGAEAERQAVFAEELRPQTPGARGQGTDETRFSDFRDLDDLYAGFFEVLTTTGKYFWIPTERVVSLEFHPPHRPRDLAWRRATISVKDGPDGEVYLPAIYDSEVPNVADNLRLGMATDWSQRSESPVRGVGQRMFLVDDEALPILLLQNLRFGI